MAMPELETTKLPDDSDVEARSPVENALLQSAAAARARRKFDLIVVPLVTMFCELRDASESLTAMLSLDIITRFPQLSGKPLRFAACAQHILK